MAVPRLPVHGDGSVALPRPLDAATVALVRRIFALQREGDVPAAVAETARLQDDTLLGDLLADRYLSKSYTPKPGQLRLWLKTFADLPDAPAIYQLLASVSPHGTRLPPQPSGATLGTEMEAAPLPEEADPATHAFSRNALLDRTVRERVGDGPKGAASALRLIAATPHLDPLYGAQLRAEVALALFANGDTAGARRVAEAAFAASDSRIGLAGYVAGLAAWRDKRLPEALELFERASRAGLTAASIRAGAAFWAARGHHREGDTAGCQSWLRVAAAAPHTFYGLIAAHRLGRDRPGLRLVSLDGRNPMLAAPGAEDGDGASHPVLSDVDVEAVAATQAGRRAFALLQVGEKARAEASLRRLWPSIGNDVALGRSIQLVAQAAGLTSLSSQLATMLQTRDGESDDPARFPTPKLRPHHGFTLDPALVYALTRLESNFDATAVSGAGAHGLMQLMPVTAGFVLGQPSRFTARTTALHDAALNLEIGQRYLTYLADQPGVRGDLIRLLASYNAGPTAVSNWNDDIGWETDPLMFIESLPAPETRAYVHRAFTYLWIYAARLGVPAPSLGKLADGKWPAFAAEQALHAATLH